jgi:lactoylglutathione lyase
MATSLAADSSLTICQYAMRDAHTDGSIEPKKRQWSSRIKLHPVAIIQDIALLQMNAAAIPKEHFMIFRYTIIYVADVASTLQFYQAAFGIETEFMHEGNDYGELRTGATKLAFSSFALMAQIGKSVATQSPAKPSFEVAFETDDVEAALKRAVAAGAILVQPVTKMPWGQTIAYVRAPEGTLIELCTAISR